MLPFQQCVHYCLEPPSAYPYRVAGVRSGVDGTQGGDTLKREDVVRHVGHDDGDHIVALQIGPRDIEKANGVVVRVTKCSREE